MILIPGVPQGFIIGSLLFALYIGVLLSDSEFCTSHFYADDTQLYLSTTSETLRKCVLLMNNDLAVISLLCTSNDL